jgi:hypothetical protein
MPELDEISHGTILGLGKKNLIVHHMLMLYHITNDRVDIFVWEQALKHMVLKFVDYVERLESENFNLINKGVREPEISIEFSNLPENEKAKILEILRSNGG